MSHEFITLPKNAKDITGQRFGRLVALGPIGRNKNRDIIWLCQCDCGNFTKNHPRSLRNGATKSCGCLKNELSSLRLKTHGMSRIPLYKTWVDMNTRCHNSTHVNYKNYGERGIVVCDEWRHNFKIFHDHVSQLPGYKIKGMSLDRIDNSLGYFPGNVRWATVIEQSHNTRKNHIIIYNGKTQCLSAWARELDIEKSILRYRLRSGWTVERALSTPTRTINETRDS